MMQRLANIHDHKLFSAISELKQEMDAYKTAQITSGKSGIKSYLTESLNTWDWTGTIGTDADTTKITTGFTVSFTGDGSQSPVMANLTFALYVNGTDLSHQLTAFENTWTDSSGRSAEIIYSSSSQDTPTEYSSHFTLQTLKAITVYLKVYTVGSCGGTVSAVRN